MCLTYYTYKYRTAAKHLIDCERASNQILGFAAVRFDTIFLNEI